MPFADKNTTADQKSNIPKINKSRFFKKIVSGKDCCYLNLTKHYISSFEMMQCGLK